MPFNKYFKETQEWNFWEFFLAVRVSCHYKWLLCQTLIADIKPRESKNPTDFGFLIL